MNDKSGIRALLRMTAEDLDFLLGKVKHLITKQDTKMRLAIPTREHMSLTLRFLATGWCDCISKLIYGLLIIVDFNVCLCIFFNFSFCLIQVNNSQSLRFQYRVGTSTISQIVMDTCAALYQVLKEDFLKVL